MSEAGPAGHKRAVRAREPGMAGQGVHASMLSSSHFIWGRSAWTLLFACIALIGYAAWRLLVALVCQGAPRGFS